MRPIKFRAWDIDLKRWSYFDLDDLVNGEASGMNLENWCQFTGLLDKNGKEIWEGDRLKIKDLGFGYEYEGIINFDDDNLSYLIRVIKDYPTIKEGKYIPIGLGRHHSFEVIGNIYSNPELLKQKD